MATDTHLYSVDGEGGVTPPQEAPKGQRKPPKGRPRFPVPTDRMTRAKAVDGLRAFCTLSQQGREPVNSEQLGRNIGLSTATASLNNMFFLDVGLLTSPAKGMYLPTPITLDFARKYSFDREAAPKLLAPAFRETWFFEAVKNRLEITPDATKAQVIEMLAGEAGTDSSYSAQYRQLLEWLDFVGLIKLEGETISITDSGKPSTFVDLKAEMPTDRTHQPQPSPTREEPTGHETPRVGVPVVSLSLDIQVGAEDLAKLDAAQITALFDGIGKVASVKAALEKN